VAPFLAAFAPILAAALLGGTAAGALGVVVVGLRMPFLAVATAHSALAGAVAAELLGGSRAAGGFLGALAGAALLERVLSRRGVDPSAALGTLFSLTMGLAFLGMGLSEGPRSAMLGMLWGSLLFVGKAQLAWMAVAAAAVAVLVVLADRPLRALVFSPELAASLIPARRVTAAVLVVAAGVIAVNLDTVGGLMVYSLIANPAVAALRWAPSWSRAVALGAGLGGASAVGGFLVAWRFDLPAGACIVLVSSLVVAAALWRRG